MMQPFLLLILQEAPATQPVAAMKTWMEKLTAWIENRAPVVLENLALALVTLILGLWVASMLTRGLRKLLIKGKVDETLAKFLGSLAYYAMFALVMLAVLERVGVQTASFIAVIGAAGLAIGFALQGSLGNLAAGVMIMLFRPFRGGDLIIAGGHEGVVEEIQVFATVLKTGDNKKIIIPNSAVTGGSIVNLTGNATRRVDMTFAVAGGENADRVKQIIRGVLAGIPQIQKSPPPDVEVWEVGAAMKLIVRPWCKATDYWVVYHAVNEGVKAAFEREKVPGPVPRTEVVRVS
jgi:small conductance mechanosensitive channel